MTRIIVSRCEVDLKKICSEYKAHFGQSLHKTILVNGAPVGKLLLLGRSSHLLPPSCRNTRRETIRRLFSACVDQRNEKERQSPASREKDAMEEWALKVHDSPNCTDVCYIPNEKVYLSVFPVMRCISVAAFAPLIAH